MGKSVLWRLVSHLSLNYLSLVQEGKDALQEILRLYDVGRTPVRTVGPPRTIRGGFRVRLRGGTRP